MLILLFFFFCYTNSQRFFFLKTESFFFFSLLFFYFSFYQYATNEKVEPIFEPASRSNNPRVILRGPAAAVEQAKAILSRLWTVDIELNEVHTTALANDKSNIEMIEKQHGVQVLIDRSTNRVVVTGDTASAQSARNSIEQLLLFLFPREFSSINVPPSLAQIVTQRGLKALLDGQGGETCLEKTINVADLTESKSGESKESTQETKCSAELSKKLHEIEDCIKSDWWQPLQILGEVLRTNPDAPVIKLRGLEAHIARAVLRVNIWLKCLALENVKLRVPKNVVSIVIGKKGSTIQLLQVCDLFFPPSKKIN